MNELFRLQNRESRSISPENFTGEKGKAGMATTGRGENAARDLGQGWKVSPCVTIKAGETFEVANIQGPGIIEQIWMTGTTRMYLTEFPIAIQKNRSLQMCRKWSKPTKRAASIPISVRRL